MSKSYFTDLSVAMCGGSMLSGPRYFCGLGGAASVIVIAVSRAARRLDSPGFLHWILEDFSWTAWRWSGWLDTQTVAFPGEPERRPDIVPTFERVAGDAPPLAIVIEFMSEVRWIILERLAEYAFRVRRELPYQTDPGVS